MVFLLLDQSLYWYWPVSKDTCKTARTSLVHINLSFILRALNMLWKSRMRDAFYGTSDPSIIDGNVPKELLGDSFEMRGYVM